MATTTSGLIPVFEVVGGSAQLEDNTLSFGQPGRLTISSSQPGSDLYSAASTVTQSFCVNPSEPLISLDQTSVAAILVSSSENGNHKTTDDHPISRPERTVEIMRRVWAAS